MRIVLALVCPLAAEHLRFTGIGGKLADKPLGEKQPDCDDNRCWCGKKDHDVPGLVLDWVHEHGLARLSPDGCGAPGMMKFDRVLPELFTQCCNQHDNDHCTCGVDRRDADEKFWNCMLKGCESRFPGNLNIVQRGICKGTAHTMGKAVKTFSQFPFNKGNCQKEHCECKIRK